jgi:hypothetical protein
MTTLVTVFQVKQGMTREHGFMSLEFMEEHAGQDRNAYDMKAYEVVFGESNIDGAVLFYTKPETNENLLWKFYELTNSPAERQSREVMQSHFGFKGRSISTSDIIRINGTYYYFGDSSEGWIEMTPKKGSVPHDVTVGMKATGYYLSDCAPYEVIKVSPSGKTVTIQSMDWKITKGTEHDGTAEYEYTSNPNGNTHTVRKTKLGMWKTPCNLKVSFGSARRYYDPHF